MNLGKWYGALGNVCETFPSRHFRQQEKAKAKAGPGGAKEGALEEEAKAMNSSQRPGIYRGWPEDDEKNTWDIEHLSIYPV